MVEKRTKLIIDGRARAPCGQHPRGLAAMTVAFGVALVGHAILGQSPDVHRASAGAPARARSGATTAALEIANAVSRGDATVTVARTQVARARTKVESRSTWRRKASADSPADAFIVDVVRTLTRVADGVDRGMVAARIDAALDSALGAMASASRDLDLERLIGQTERRAVWATAVASADAAMMKLTSVARLASDVPGAAAVRVPPNSSPRVALKAQARVTEGGAFAKARGAVKVDANTVDIGETLRRQIKASLGGVKACYERALKRNARLAGRYAIRFSIGDGGRVEDEGLDEDTVRDVEMATCVRAQVRRWRFAPKDAAMAPVVSYGVSFAPDPAADWSPR